MGAVVNNNPDFLDQVEWVLDQFLQNDLDRKIVFISKKIILGAIGFMVVAELTKLAHPRMAAIPLRDRLLHASALVMGLTLLYALYKNSIL